MFTSPKALSSNKSKMVDEAYSIMKEMHGNKRERNEYTLFGEHIALKL